jgi:hypothetical protein
VDVKVLEREIYTEAEAARVLRVAQSTLHYWLEGGVRRGKRYEPVIREEPRGTRSVTWAEFVEAGLLRQYRREHQVPMTELRHFIGALGTKLGVPYPLEAQDEAELAPEYFLVAMAREQLVLTAPSQLFVDRVTWDGGVAAAWRPHDDVESPVRVNPLQRFGRPAIGGVSTEVLWEYDDSGEDVDENRPVILARTSRRALGARIREFPPGGVSPGTKPADVRLYFDAQGISVAYHVHGVTGHRMDPIVADVGWLIITRDSRIQDRPAELAAVRDNSAKMVALSGRDATTTWNQLEVPFTQWRAIDPLSTKDGPFISRPHDPAFAMSTSARRASHWPYSLRTLNSSDSTGSSRLVRSYGT